MWVESKRFTADVHTDKIAKIYGFYNYNSCNVRHCAGSPVGEPAMTRMVKVDKIKPMEKYVFCLPSSQ